MKVDVGEPAGLLAVVISVASAWYTARVARIEKDRRAEEVSASKVATMSARFEHWGHAHQGSGNRLVLSQRGTGDRLRRELFVP